MSDIRANTISDTSGNGPINLHKQNAAKFWIKMAIDASPIGSGLNLSSATDVSNGITSITFTNNMVSASRYIPHVTISTSAEANYTPAVSPMANTGFTVSVVDEQSNFADRAFLTSAVGELA